MPLLSEQPPKIAIAGAGVVARDIIPAFCAALHSEEKQLSSLQILTRSSRDEWANESSEKYRADLVKFEESGAEIKQVDYEKEESLVEALRGVDALLCIFGTYKGNWIQSQKALALAAVKAGVRIFFPSEWGLDTRFGKCSDWELAYVAKRDFFDWAAQLSPNMRVIGVFQGLHLDKVFCAWGGFDSAASTWQIVGSGNTPVAMTALRDVGPAALRTVVMSLEEPSKIPQFVRFQSQNRSLVEYSACFEKVSGVPIKKIHQDFQDAKFEYLEKQFYCNKFEVLGLHLRICMEEGGVDQSANHNEIINPGEKYFKWTTAEQYAKEVGGRPWDNYTMPSFK